MHREAWLYAKASDAGPLIGLECNMLAETPTIIESFCDIFLTEWTRTIHPLLGFSDAFGPLVEKACVSGLS